MKTSKKALALALAAAMAFTGIPATNAEAASKAKLSATKAAIYVGGSKTVSVKAPSTWKSVAISTVSSNKKSVATVKKASSKSFKVTAVKAGTAKVTVKVSYKTSTKKNAKKYTKTLAFTANVKSTTLTAKPGKSTLYIGETTKVTAKAVPSSAKITYATGNKKIATVNSKGNIKAVKAGKVTIAAYAKYGTKKVRKAFTITVKEPAVKATLENPTLAVGEKAELKVTTTPSSATCAFKSSDENVATVSENGEITAVKAGTATITTTLTYKGTTKEVKTDVTVKTIILKDVKQTKYNTLEAVIAGDTSSIKAENIVIKNTSNNVTYAVKPVSVDATDKTKVTITTFGEMKDGKEYSVTLDDVTKTFTATDGKPVTVKVSPVTIPYATLSTISAIAVDAHDVVVGEALYNNGANVTLAGKTAEFKITPVAGGYTTGATLYLAKKDDTAKAKVVIKSGEYDNTGKEINNVESEEITITAVDQEVVSVSDFKARVSKENSKSFDEVKDATSLAVGEQGYAYFKITNSKNEEIANADYANYKVESSDSNVLVVAAGPLSYNSSKKGSNAVAAYGVATGTAYLIVKDTKNKDAVVATIPVTVNAKRAVDSLTLDRTSFVLATASGVNTETVNITVKDQYGEKMTTGYTAEVEVLSSPAGATASDVTVADGDTTKAVFTGNSSAKEGNYVFKVTVKDTTTKVTRAQVVTVNVKAPTGTPTYAFEIAGVDADNTVDATLKDGVAPKKNEVTIKIVKTQGGVKVAYEANTTGITVKKGDDVMTIASGASASIASFTAVDVDSNIATAAAAGTYVVSGKTSDGANIAPVTFIVKNDTAKVTAVQTQNSVAKDVTLNEEELCKSFDFYFGSKKLTKDNITLNEVKAVVDGAPEAEITQVSGGKVAYITTVKLTVKVDGTNGFYVTVPVNRSVTGK